VNPTREYILSTLSLHNIKVTDLQLEKLRTTIKNHHRLLELLFNEETGKSIDKFALTPKWTMERFLENIYPGTEGKIQRSAKSILKESPDVQSYSLYFQSSHSMKQLSPIQSVKKSLESIDKYGDSSIFIRVFKERALKDADELGRKKASDLPLYGTTAAIKDIIAVSGHKMTAGSKVLDIEPAEDDAPVVKNLRKAGAIIVGVTNLHELAFGTTNINPHFGIVRNPINSEFISGGSSGGSAAAVKLGMVDFSLGTDTGGSVRIPASCCGIVGFKPSFGLLPLEGVFPLGYTLDHVGIMADSVWKVAVVTEAIIGSYGYFTSDLLESPFSGSREDRISRKTDAGYSEPDKSRQNIPHRDREKLNSTGMVGSDFEGIKLKGLRIGVPGDFFLEEIQDEIKDGFNIAIEKLKNRGTQVIKIDLPFHRYAPACYLCTSGPEALGLHYTRLINKSHLLGEDVLIRLIAALFIPAFARVKAQRIRELMFMELQEAFKRVDIIATPTLAVTVPKINEKLVSINGRDYDVISILLRNTSPFNLTGVPAITIPCGKDRSGIPIGLQLICGYGEDIKLLRLSSAIEIALDYEKNV